MTAPASTAILPSTTIARIVAARDAALARMTEAADAMAQGQQLATEAADLAEQANGGASYYLQDRTQDGHYKRLFECFDRDASLAMYRKHLDATVWTHLVSITGMAALMDRTAKEHLDRDLCADVPEITEQAILDVFTALRGDANLIFQRGLARCFSDLDRRFKSHDAFQIGARMVLTHVFNQWGMMSYNSGMRETLADVERTFAVLDGVPPQPGRLEHAIRETRDRGGYQPHQSQAETDYFRIRCFKNGNAHLWFTRDDLVEKANLVLADYYGAVLPDAVPPETTVADLKSPTCALAKNLAYYWTPPEVAETVLGDVYVKGQRVLEPSAGEGHLVKALLAKGANVTAVEVHPGRLQALSALSVFHRNLEVVAGNFLSMPQRDDFDAVVMNPPFEGTHWMEHVIHAHGFLAPGGKLVAILPASAEVGTTAKHEAFRAWAHERGDWRSFRNLPPESFAGAGTRVQTVYLTLTRARG